MRSMVMEWYELEPVRFELVVEARPADLQRSRSAGLPTAMLSQRLYDSAALGLLGRVPRHMTKAVRYVRRGRLAKDVVAGQNRARRGQHRAFDRMLQLTNVARPRRGD